MPSILIARENIFVDGHAANNFKEIDCKYYINHDDSGSGDDDIDNSDNSGFILLQKRKQRDASERTFRDLFERFHQIRNHVVPATGMHTRNYALNVSTMDDVPSNNNTTANQDYLNNTQETDNNAANIAVKSKSKSPTDRATTEEDDDKKHPRESHFSCFAEDSWPDADEE
jgi:hypothetical protein